jgi:DNA invertase Pin-like site-specific DNA recombinase
MIYGYARVSTNGQARDGFGLEVQSAQLKEAGAECIFCDHFTGTKSSRPELDKLLSVIKSGDTLIVAKLDRIARSASQGTALVIQLLDRGIKVHILNMGMMDNTPTGKLIRGIMFAFAEFERDMIVERTAEGKKIAKQKPNYREGRPKKVIPNFATYYQKQQDGEITIPEACSILNISKSSWYNFAKSMGGTT